MSTKTSTNFKCNKLCGKSLLVGPLRFDSNEQHFLFQSEYDRKWNHDFKNIHQVMYFLINPRTKGYWIHIHQVRILAKSTKYFNQRMSFFIYIIQSFSFKQKKTIINSHVHMLVNNNPKFNFLIKSLVLHHTIFCLRK
jgi:hypothetical protein